MRPTFFEPYKSPLPLNPPLHRLSCEVEGCGGGGGGPPERLSVSFDSVGRGRGDIRIIKYRFVN